MWYQPMGLAGFVITSPAPAVTSGTASGSSSATSWRCWAVQATRPAARTALKRIRFTGSTFRGCCRSRACCSSRTCCRRPGACRRRSRWAPRRRCWRCRPCPQAPGASAWWRRWCRNTLLSLLGVDLAGVSLAVEDSDLDVLSVLELLGADLGTVLDCVLERGGHGGSFRSGRRPRTSTRVRVELQGWVV